MAGSIFFREGKKKKKKQLFFTVPMMQVEKFGCCSHDEDPSHDSDSCTCSSVAACRWHLMSTALYRVLLDFVLINSGKVVILFLALKTCLSLAGLQFVWSGSLQCHTFGA